jgi:hypothetical protein
LTFTPRGSSARIDVRLWRGSFAAILLLERRSPDSLNTHSMAGVRFKQSPRAATACGDDMEIPLAICRGWTRSFTDYSRISVLYFKAKCKEPKLHAD